MRDQVEWWGGRGYMPQTSRLGFRYLGRRDRRCWAVETEQIEG